MAKLLIKNGIVVTVDPQRRIIRDGAVAIQDDKIVGVDKTAKLAEFQAEKVIDAGGNVVMPGFVDMHHHTRQSLQRGLHDAGATTNIKSSVHVDSAGRASSDFERTMPMDHNMTAEDMYLNTLLSCIELTRTGTTCYMDTGTPHPDSVAQGMIDFGMRGLISYRGWDLRQEGPDGFVWDIPDSGGTTDQVLAMQQALRKKWHGAAGGRIRFAYGVRRGEIDVSDDLYRRITALAQRDNAPVHVHIALSRATVQWFKERTGTTPVEYLHKLGVLSPNWAFIHCVYLTDHEVDLMASSGARAIAAPGCSVHDAYGAFSHGKFPEMLQKGVLVALSSDAALTGNVFDKFRLMHLFCTVHKEVRLDPAIINPETCVEIATINGAKVAFWDDQIGSIEAGKKADIIIVDVHRSNWQPLHDFNIIPNMVYSASGDDVLTTIIDGKLIMENRSFLHINVQDGLRKAQAASERLLAEAPYRLLPRWPVE